MLLVSLSPSEIPQTECFGVVFFFIVEIPHDGLCQMWHVRMHLNGAVLIDVLTRWPLGGKQHS